MENRVIQCEMTYIRRLKKRGGTGANDEKRRPIRQIGSQPGARVANNVTLTLTMAIINTAIIDGDCRANAANQRENQAYSDYHLHIHIHPYAILVM